MLLIDVFATILAVLVLGLYKGFSAALIPLFLGVLAGSVIIRILRPRRGNEVQLEQINSKFKEKLATEGVIDETADMARARRFARWQGEEKFYEFVSSQVEDFAELMRHSGKTYVVHRQTLNRLLAKLPIRDQDLKMLTPAERHVFDVLCVTGRIALGENQEWRK